MATTIREFVMQQPLFCHHNHHVSFREFDAGRAGYNHTHLLGYADTDLRTAAGARPPKGENWLAHLDDFWSKIRTTGYGCAVTLACRELFGLEYSPEHFADITRALQASIAGKSASEVFDCFVREKSGTKWILSDAKLDVTDLAAYAEDLHPTYYRFAWRRDDLFYPTSFVPFARLEQGTNTAILSLDGLVQALHASIDGFKGAGRLQAFKIGMAYGRDIYVADPTKHEAELAFNRLRSRARPTEGVHQDSGRVNAHEARPLGDYLFHRVLERAHDEDVPVQVHTGYLWGHWGSLLGTNASLLLPIFEKYRRVRFDLMHASWPWVSELGAIAKNYPNVYPDLCWAWTMNPAASERALSEWLDAVPFNKIFGYGADTGFPWCDVGYALQARLGIAHVLEQKIAAGYFSPSTGEEVAAAIMLHNGEELLGLG